MNVTIEIPDDKRPALIAKATTLGVSAEQYVQRMVERDLHDLEEPPLGSGTEPFWKSFTRDLHALPDAVFERLPTDAASEHDHYIYGTPKRDA